MYLIIGIILAVIIVYFLWSCFVLWLSAKVIGAPGGGWNNCVQVMGKCIGIVFLLSLAGGLSLLFLEEMSLIAAIALIIIVAIYFIASITMDTLEIGLLKFILLCIVQSVIESAFSYGLSWVDKFYPFFEQVQQWVMAVPGKFGV